MTYYLIECPYVSSGLKRTYYKKLEVLAGELTPSANSRNTYSTFKVTAVHTYKKGKWVEKSGTRAISRYVGTGSIHSDLNFTTNSYSQNDKVFTSLELAKAAKLLAIQNMGVVYSKELVRLQELFDRNVPDISVPLAELYTEYPEYFL
jgi:hypothetical protein